jgi:hypothetical protein
MCRSADNANLSVINVNIVKNNIETLFDASCVFRLEINVKSGHVLLF